MSDKEQILKITGREEARDKTLIGITCIQKIDIIAIGHKGKRAKALQFLYLSNVKFSLSLGETRVN